MMRLNRITLAALLPFAALACSEEAPETEAEAPQVQAEAKSDFAQEPPAPPPSSWSDEDFSEDNDTSDSSFSDQGASNAEGLK